MPRRPLSNAAEESHFLAADEACEACASGMKAAILSRFRSDAASMDRSMLALAASYSAPSAIRMAFKPMEAAQRWASQLLSDDRFSQKARPTAHEAELIDAAIGAGLDLGLNTLPAKIRGEVDIEAARKLARKRLVKGAFRQNLAAYEESLRGLERLANASRDPALTILKDPERLADAFGLTGRQADALARETKALVANKKATAAIKQAMADRLRQALEARAEVLGQTLANEAINTAQQALFEIAESQGLLDADKQVREWITRRDERVCPICDGFDGKRAEIGEPFVSDDGEEAYQTGIHPRCRCRVRLVTVRSPKRARRAA